MEGIAPVLSIFATIASVLLFASPLKEIQLIRDTKNKRGQTILPLIFMWMNCCLWGIYGGQTKVFIMIFINFIGCCFAIYYVYVWMIVSDGLERLHVLMVVMGACTLVFFAIFYAHTLNSYSVSIDVANYLPISANIISVLMFASPLVQMVSKIIILI